MNAQAALDELPTSLRFPAQMNATCSQLDFTLDITVIWKLV